MMETTNVEDTNGTMSHSPTEDAPQAATDEKRVAIEQEENTFVVASNQDVEQNGSRTKTQTDLNDIRSLLSPEDVAIGPPIDIPEGYLESLGLEVVDLDFGGQTFENAVVEDESLSKDDVVGTDDVNENLIAQDGHALASSDSDEDSGEEKPEEPPSREYFINLAKPTPEQIALTSLSAPPPPATSPQALLFGPPRPPYILKLSLLPTTNPTVSRTLSIPAEATFSTLHTAIQTAFNWYHLHSYFFNILKLPDGTPVQDILDGVGFVAKDQYWCRLDGVPEISEEKVVKVLDSKVVRLYQVWDRWIDWSLESGVRTERKGRDAEVKQTEDERVPVIEYEYDLLLGWIHRVEIVGRGYDEAGYNRIVCLDGVGHPAAEDLEPGLPVSGEWEKLKEVYRVLDKAAEEAVGGKSEDVDVKEVLTSEQRQLKFWYEKDCMNGDSKGLGGGRVDVWNRDKVNERLSKLKIQGLGQVVAEDERIAKVIKKEVKPECCGRLNDYGDDRRRDEKKGLTAVEDWVEKSE